MKFKFNSVLFLLGVLGVLAVQPVQADTNAVVDAGAAITNKSAIVNAIDKAVGPGADVAIQYLSANTNALQATEWSFFGSYTIATGLPKGTSGRGYSFGAVYHQNQYVGEQIRVQYLDTGTGGGANAILLPNGSITLGSTYQPFGSWLTLRPLAEAGAAVNLKSDAFAIIGLGSEADFFATTNQAALFQRASVFYGKEKWTGQNVQFNDTQYGVALDFNLETLMAKINAGLHKIHL